MSKITGYQVSIAGPNCEIGSSYAEKKCLNNISFLGYLTHHELLKQIMKSDIIVIPSFDEGIANIAMEGMLAEKLVISRAVGGMGELIKNYQNGLLFNTDEDLKNLLIEIQYAFQQNDCEDLNKIRRQARISIVKQFDNNKMIDEYSQLYKEHFYCKN